MRHIDSVKLFCVALTAFFTSCLGTADPPKEPNIFSLTITIPNAGQDFVVGNDTLTVIDFKMLIDSIRVLKNGQDEERFEPRPRLASYILGVADSYNIGAGTVRGGKFNGVGYSLVRPSLQGNFEDPDLIEKDSRGFPIDSYSFSLNGVYKQNFFRFRSKVIKAVQYNFSTTVQLGDFNGYIEARLRGNWKQWFVNSAGNGIMDPRDPANKTQIEDNILKYFDIFTISFGEVQQ